MGVWKYEGAKPPCFQSGGGGAQAHPAPYISLPLLVYGHDMENRSFCELDIRKDDCRTKISVMALWEGASLVYEMKTFVVDRKQL